MITERDVADENVGNGNYLETEKSLNPPMKWNA